MKKVPENCQPTIKKMCQDTRKKEKALRRANRASIWKDNNPNANSENSNLVNSEKNQDIETENIDLLDPKEVVEEEEFFTKDPSLPNYVAPEKKDRSSWEGHLDFIMSMLGSAVVSGMFGCFHISATKCSRYDKMYNF